MLPAAAVTGAAWVPFGLATHRLLRGRFSAAQAGLALVVLPSVWLTTVALRSWKHLGGTWGLLGLSQWRVRPVLAVASLGGVWLISFLLVAVNVGVAATAGSDVLVNVDARTPTGRITKSTRQYTPDGLAGVYEKQRLVPFGEYIPLRPLLGWVTEFTEAAEVDRAPGDEPMTLRVAGVVVGPLISYESTFPDLHRTLARMGAELTLVQGSLTTFQGTWAHQQQASFEAVRAVESV